MACLALGIFVCLPSGHARSHVRSAPQKGDYTSGKPAIRVFGIREQSSVSLQSLPRFRRFARAVERRILSSARSQDHELNWNTARAASTLFAVSCGLLGYAINNVGASF